MRHFATATALVLAAFAGSAMADTVVITSDTTITPGDSAYTNHDIVVRGCTVTLNGEFHFASLTVESNGSSPGRVTHSPNRVTGNVNGMLVVVTGNLLIDPSSSINVDYAGYPGNTGPGTGTAGGGGCGGAGAGYGGMGGHGNCADRPGGPAYGSDTQPTDFGSGGNGHPCCGSGGPGGGAVRLIVGGVCTINGFVSSRGDTRVNAAGGSGGSIWISARDLAGSGVLRADGGPQGTSNNSGGGGAGGRIAVTGLCSRSPSITMLVPGGDGNQDGFPGTVYVDILDAAAITDQPDSHFVCPTGTGVFTVSAGGDGPLTYQWQVELAGEQGTWTSLTDGAVSSVGDVSGATTETLSISGVLAANNSFRCVVSNTCGTATSTGATLGICPVDFDCDGFLTGIDYDMYVTAFEAGDTAADFDGDEFITGIDFDLYVQAFEAGC